MGPSISPLTNFFNDTASTSISFSPRMSFFSKKISLGTASLDVNFGRPSGPVPAVKISFALNRRY